MSCFILLYRDYSVRSVGIWGFPGGAVVKNPVNAGDAERRVQEGPLERGMTTHSRSLAWRIPWTREPAGMQWGSQGLGHW